MTLQSHESGANLLHRNVANDGHLSNAEGRTRDLPDELDNKYSVPVEEELGVKDLLVGKTKKWSTDAIDSWRVKKKSFGILDWCEFFLPCIAWLRRYKIKEYLLHDIAAGLSVGFMVVPQGMSYANLAGLPSVFGLYGAWIPVWVYAAFGSSRHLAVGPVAVTSLLLYNGITRSIFKNPNDNFNNPSDPAAQNQYNMIAVQVAFIAGWMYFGVGLLRLSFLTNFLSHAVISGFTTGAAVIIALTQVKYFLGYNRWYFPDLVAVCSGTSCVCPDNLLYNKSNGECYKTFPRDNSIVPAIYHLIQWHSQFQWREFVMSVAWMIILISFKEGARLAAKSSNQWVRKLRILRALGPITVMIIGIAISNIWDLYKPPYNINVVGTIKKGPPQWTGGWMSNFSSSGAIVGLAVLVCAIDVMESISIATTLALRAKYELKYTQELLGLGVANITGSLFSCYTTTGSFSRSAVNYDVGAKTGLAGFISGTVVMLTVLLITPVFKNMPTNVQGAIIISACITLLDFRSPLFYWKVNKLDLLVWLVAWLCTMFFSVEIGLVVSILLSLALIVMQVAFPHSAQLGLLPGTNVYRNIKQYPETVTFPGLCLVRWDAPLYFANCQPMRRMLVKYEARASELASNHGKKLRFTIIDLSPVTDVDGTALHLLQEIIKSHQDTGVQLVLVNPNRILATKFARAKIPEQIGEHFMFVRMHDAVQACLRILEESSHEEKLAVEKQQQVDLHV